MQKNSIPVFDKRAVSTNFGDGEENLGTIVFITNQKDDGVSVFAARYYRAQGSDVCINYEQARSGKVEKIADSIIVTSPEMTTRDCGPFEGLYVILNNEVYSFSGEEYSAALDKYTKLNFPANTFLDCHSILTCSNWTATLINDPIAYNNTLEVVRKYLLPGKLPLFVLDSGNLDSFILKALYSKDEVIRNLQETYHKIQHTNNNPESPKVFVKVDSVGEQ